MIHQLKTESGFFNSVVNGTKTFEVRDNDRNFKVGDFLALNEVSPDEVGNMAETGCCCMVEVVYVLCDERFCLPGKVVLGIRPCIVNTSSERLMYDRGDSYYKVRVYCDPTKGERRHET